MEKKIYQVLQLSKVPAFKDKWMAVESRKLTNYVSNSQNFIIKEALEVVTDVWNKMVDQSTDQLVGITIHRA